MAGATVNDRLTPRELFVLANTVEDNNWSHTAQLTAAIVNMLKGGKSKPYDADRFNPIRARRKPQPAKGMSIASAVAAYKAAEKLEQERNAHYASGTEPELQN